MLFCKPAAAARRKSYKTSDRSEVVERSRARNLRSKTRSRRRLAFVKKTYYSWFYIRDVVQPGRALAWGLRKEKLPAEVFRTKGEVLLFCKPAAAARRKSYKTSDRSEVVERSRARNLRSKTRSRRRLAFVKKTYYSWFYIRDVVQPGRALAWGARSRRFKSSRPDQIKKPALCRFFLYKDRGSNRTGRVICRFDCRK